MFRETLDPGAATILMKLGDVGGREGGFGYRTTAGGNTDHSGWQ